MSMKLDNRILCQFKELPVFQNRMYDSREEARNCPRGDVVLVEDAITGLVYNSSFDPTKLNYDANYQNEQGVSAHFRAHLEEVADIVVRLLGRRQIMEVGCGKGSFLEMLEQRGIDIWGHDPAYEGSNPHIRKTYFNESQGLRSTGLVLRHVLEHIARPFEFLSSIARANGGGGLIYIEVPCFEWICRHRSWFDVFYEHVNYFRIPDFERMFGRVVESGHLFGGQYLYVVADLATLRAPRFEPEHAVRFPSAFLASLAATLQHDEQNGDRPTAIWGGASKGVIFALHRERANRPIETVIDINPAKQGRYLPGTGLRVQSPTEALPALPQGATLYVMNPNYLAEIKDMSNHAYEYVKIDGDTLSN